MAHEAPIGRSLIMVRTAVLKYKGWRVFVKCAYLRG